MLESRYVPHCLVVIPPYRDATVVEAVECILLLIWVPMIWILIPLWDVECGLQEFEHSMLVLVDAFVLVAHPPSEVVLQRRGELPQIRLTRSVVECFGFWQVASLVLQLFLPSTHGLVDVVLCAMVPLDVYDSPWVFGVTVESRMHHWLLNCGLERLTCGLNSLTRWYWGRCRHRIDRCL